MGIQFGEKPEFETSDQLRRRLIKVGIILLIAFVISMVVVFGTHVEASTINFYSEGIRNESVEYLYVFNPAGYVLFGLKGNEDKVLVPNRYLYLLENSITLHNHPNGIAEFSEQDLRFFSETRSAEMWVVTNDTLLIMHRDGYVTKQNWSDVWMTRLALTKLYS